MLDRRLTVALTAAIALIVLATPGMAQDPEYGFLDPMGPIARVQRTELIWASIIISIAVVPVIIGTPFIFWRYRRSNDRSTYRPAWNFDTKLELVQWGVPIVIVITLSIWLAQAVYLLDPYRDIDAEMADRLDVELTGEPVRVDVIGLDWKWLFLYPDLGVASVGELVVPVGRPVSMRLTTDTVMQSFMAPGLAGQIYAMAGMSTKMSLIADKPGTTLAENTQYNGPGFARQRSQVRAVEDDAFDNWVARQQAAEPLDAQAYARLAQSGDLEMVQRTFNRAGGQAVGFSLAEPLLFDRVLARYRSGNPVPPEQQPGSPSYDPQAAILPDVMPAQQMEGMQ